MSISKVCGSNTGHKTFPSKTRQNSASKKGQKYYKSHQ